MVASAPKTKAKEILEFFQKLTVADEDPSEFHARRILREIESSIRSGVDLGMAWLCKGLYFSYMSEPEQMDNAFKNSIKYGATDQVSYFNRAAHYHAYGYFDEAMYGYSQNNDDESYSEMQRVLRSTLDFERYEHYFLNTDHYSGIAKTLESFKKCDLNVSDLKTSLDIFLDILRSKKIRFSLARYSIYQDEYALYFAIKSEKENLIEEILNEYDKQTSSLELFVKSRKLNIILLFHTPYFERISA